MQKQREHWSSHLGFILAAAGSAVGLGTLWQVPYVTGENGGGVFVLVYFLCTFLIGVPVFIAELILGRRSQRGAVGTFIVLAEDKAIWKAGGWFGVISSFLILSHDVGPLPHADGPHDLQHNPARLRGCLEIHVFARLGPL